jgi:hypothetical protein
MNCRYDRDADAYLNDDGDPCRRDEYGDPTYHCTARKSCASHIGADDLTCPRCVGRARRDLRTIRDLAPLMLTVAIGAGVNSEAANLAGPAADVEAWTWRKVAALNGGSWHVSLVEDDDEEHPYTVLTRWQLMLSEDYGHELPDRLTTLGAADYLDRHLTRIAQDDGQDFPLLARELRRCRNHLESVMRDSGRKERGAPCPICKEDERMVRLTREYGHWCEDEDCERIHYDTDEGDAWVCPRNRSHVWTEKDYRAWVEDRETRTA